MEVELIDDAYDSQTAHLFYSPDFFSYIAALLRGLGGTEEQTIWRFNFLSELLFEFDLYFLRTSPAPETGMSVGLTQPSVRIGLLIHRDNGLRFLMRRPGEGPKASAYTEWVTKARIATTLL